MGSCVLSLSTDGSPSRDRSLATHSVLTQHFHCPALCSGSRRKIIQRAVSFLGDDAHCGTVPVLRRGGLGEEKPSSEVGGSRGREGGRRGHVRGAWAGGASQRLLLGGEQSPGWLRSRQDTGRLSPFPRSDSSWEETDSLRWWLVSAGAAVSGRRKNTAPHSAVRWSDRPLSNSVFSHSTQSPSSKRSDFCCFLLSF